MTKKRKKYRFLFFGLIYKRGTLVKFSSTSVDFNIQYTMDPNNQLYIDVQILVGISLAAIIDILLNTVTNILLLKKSINRSHYLIVISFFDPAWYQTLIFNFVTECQNAIVFGIEIWVLIELRIKCKTHVNER